MTGGLGRRPRTVSASPRCGPLPHTPLRSSSLHGEDFPRTLIRGSPDGTIEPRRATIEAVAYSRNPLQQPSIPLRGVTTTKEPTDGSARRWEGGLAREPRTPPEEAPSVDENQGSTVWYPLGASPRSPRGGGWQDQGGVCARGNAGRGCAKVLP
jgi:hypothetical protein